MKIKRRMTRLENCKNNSSKRAKIKEVSKNLGYAMRGWEELNEMAIEMYRQLEAQIIDQYILMYAKNVYFFSIQEGL
jgi:hypothetical protein